MAKAKKKTKSAAECVPLNKVTEDRMRRTLERRGYILYKSRRRDPEAIDYNGFMIADAETNACIAGGDPYAYSLTLADASIAAS